MPESPLIAVVDDDPFFLDSMRRLLKAHGYSVAAFPSAVEFLTSSRLASTACLIADIHMPAMTGLDLCEHLLAIGNTMPTILITAYPEEAARRRVQSLGVSCYLRKPLEESDLIDCLRRAFAREPPRAAP